MNWLLCSLFCTMMSVGGPQQTDQLNFIAFFKQAYDASFTGLDQMRDAKTGNWAFEKSFADFDRCTIRFDLDKHVHVIDFVRAVEDPGSASDFRKRYEGQLFHAFPMEQFKRTEIALDNGKETVFTYNSTDKQEREKFPEIHVAAIQKDGKDMLMISLYEPAIKKGS